MKRSIILILLIAIFSLSCSFSVLAGDDVTVTSFDSKIAVNADKSATVAENYALRFDRATESFVREIPLFNDVEQYDIRDISVSGATFTAERTAKAVVLTITPEQGAEFEGNQSFVLRYTRVAYKDRDEACDWYYSDLTPVLRGTTIEKATAIISFPVAWEDYALFLGHHDDGSAEGLNVEKKDNSLTITGKRPLQGGESIRLRAQMPGGTFDEGPKQVYDYTIDSFRADMTLGEKRSLQVSETLTFTFGKDKDVQSILRGLPLYDKSTQTYATIDGVSAEGCTVEYTVDEDHIAWLTLHKDGGFAGTQEITLHYALDYPNDKTAGSDVFFIAAPGYYWFCPVKAYDVRVTLPAKYMNYDVAVSRYHEFNKYEDNTPVTVNEAPEGEEINYNRRIITLRGENLPMRMGVALDISFHDYVFASKWNDWEKVIPYAAGGVVLLALILLFVFAVRKKKVHEVSFTPPGELDPAALRYLIDGRTTNSDSAALIYYWASRGHLEIIPYRGEVALRLTEPLPATAPAYERALYESLQKACADGEALPLSAIGARAGEFTTTLRYKLRRGFQKHNEQGRHDLISAIAGIGTAILGAAPLTLLYVATMTGLDRPEDYIGKTVSFWFIGLALLCLGGHFWFKLVRHTRGRRSNSSQRALITLSAFLLVVIGVATIMVCALSEVHFLPALCALLSAYLAVMLSALIRRPSPHIEALAAQSRLFMELLAGDRDAAPAPAQEPQLFWQLLPYACGLGLIQPWSERYRGLALAAPPWFRSRARYCSSDVYGQEADNLFWSIAAAFRSRTAGEATDAPAQTSLAAGLLADDEHTEYSDATEETVIYNSDEAPATTAPERPPGPRTMIGKILHSAFRALPPAEQPEVFTTGDPRTAAERGSLLQKIFRTARRKQATAEAPPANAEQTPADANEQEDETV